LLDLYANWPAPKNIIALATTRRNGFSLSPFGSNNMGLHVQDNSEHVIANRNAVIERLGLPNTPEWLEQTHSTTCVVIENEHNRSADAAITRKTDQVIAIMTADCLPILLCDKAGNEIAGIHAGWKGLVNGIIETTLEKMQSKSHNLLAWIGPSICKTCYQVGDDVRDLYTERYSFAADYFQPDGNRWRAAMPQLAEAILKQTGIMSVYQSNACTFERKNDFYSYRREGQTGRIASLIWFNQKQD